VIEALCKSVLNVYVIFNYVLRTPYILKFNMAFNFAICVLCSCLLSFSSEHVCLCPLSHMLENDDCSRSFKVKNGEYINEDAMNYNVTNVRLLEAFYDYNNNNNNNNKYVKNRRIM